MDQETERLKNLLQRAVINLEATRSQLKILQDQIAEPIAVIGMGCRFPGGNDPEQFWHFINTEGDGITEIPSERWDVEEYYNPDPEAPGKMYVRSGGFLKDPIDRCDPHFFGISPREVEFLDPQQRLALEVAWEALENAGINPTELRQSLTGVFLGVSGHDFYDLLQQTNSETSNNPYFATGNFASTLVGRISFIMGFQGPCVAVDTACSSSLVAIHDACQSLRNKDCNIALAGGVNLLLAPELFISFCKAHMLAKDGRCKTFDAAADGYGRGEGCGMIVLKRLSQAIQDGDRIFAIIRESGINQDGATSGLTVPNQDAQEALMRSVWTKAQIKPDDIDYLETHGTGTSLGDPIEIQAIEAAMKNERQAAHALWLGTVKTNIGHLESAAGIAGVIKIILALQHQTIPKHLHFKTLNPLLHLEGIPAKIPLEATHWPSGEKPRIAAVSSFGFGGTNAHAIIQEAPQIKISQASQTWPLYPFVLAAKTEQALKELIDRYLEFIPQAEASIDDIAYTANTGRAHFDYRIACLVTSKDDLISQLDLAKDNIIHISHPKQSLKQLKPPSDPPLGDWRKFFQDIINSYLTGDNINWKALYDSHARQKVTLPTYPFQRERYWPLQLSQQKGSSSCFFRLQWDETPIQPVNGTLDGAWLVFTDQKSIPLAFIQHIELGGGSCIQVTPGDHFQKIDEKHYTCNPLQADEFQKILLNVQTPLQGIVYFWGGRFLDITQLDEVSLSHAQALSCGGALSLMQSLIHMLDNGQVCPPVWYVTEKAQSLEQDQDVNLVAAPLIGLHRTFVEEYPQIQSCQVDIEVIDQLLKEIQNGHSDVQPAWRGNNRYTASLTYEDATPQNIVLDPNGVYLITGGLGGLGQFIAKSLIEHGAKHLSIIGRRSADSKTTAKIDILSELGVEVQYHPVDVADASALETLLSNITLQLPLKGVIHAAGVLEDAVLRNQTWQNFINVFAPKVTGSWNLHQAIERLNISPDFVIFFSSLSGIVGNPGQANYAAANTFMDSLAHYRQKRGLPSLSLDWGAWETEGMLSGNKTATQLSQTRLPGVSSFNAKTGIKAFEIALGYQGSQAILSKMQLKNGEHFSPYWKQLFKNLLPKELILSPQGILEEKLTNLAPDQRKAVLRAHLNEKIIQVLALPTETTIEEHKGFFELGMDSLMSLELKNLLQRDLGPSYTLSDTLIFNYPNSSALTQYLEDLLEHRIIEKQKAVQRTYIEEPIAIIGMSCRFPGGANSIDELWKLLIEGRDGISEVPSDRWDNDQYYSSIPDQPGKIITKKGGFLDRVDLFDAGFFGITPREAEMMDPQQRLILETAWEALERAGYAPLSLKGTLTGVYVGVAASEYQAVLTKYGREEDLNAYIATGNSASAVPGRLSYFLGLQGPCLSIDTACSSSLVAVHEACQGLRNGECDLALAGGVNVLLSPDNMIILSLAHMLSPEGYCHTFDAKADGYVRSEGCGIIVLKTLQKAIQDNDNILAVIRGSAVQQDGSSGGLTVPNGQAQERLMQQAIENAKVSPADIQYLEAHGTGTSLGDPIEVQAISEVYGQNRTASLMLGAIKSNIGHTESAAGIAGLIKVVLSLIHQKIPQDLHFESLNPKINLETIPAQLAVAPLPWPKAEKPRLAAVSSFGFSGIIAHAILEEAPIKEVISVASDRPLHLLTLSAKTAEALENLRNNFIHYLKNTEDSIADIAYTANTGRVHFNYRIAILAQNPSEAMAHLAAATPVNAEEWRLSNPQVNIDSLNSQANDQLNDLKTIKHETEWEEKLTSLAELYLKGAQIDWKGFDQPFIRKKVILPTYPFERKRYWAKVLDEKIPNRAWPKSISKNGLLTHNIESPLATIFESEISASSPDFIKDHRLYDLPVLAGASYLSALLTLSTMLSYHGRIDLVDIEFLRPLVLQEHESRLLQTLVYPSEAGKQRVEFQSRLQVSENHEGWIKHVEAWLSIEKEEIPTQPLESIKNRCLQTYDENELWEFANNLGITFGPHFRWLKAIAIGDDEAIGELRQPEGNEMDYQPFHPGLIDSCFQLSFAQQIFRSDTKTLQIPFNIKRISCNPHEGPPAWVHAQFSADKSFVDFTLYNREGRVVGSINAFEGKKITKEQLFKSLEPTSKIGELFYIEHWLQEPLLEHPRTLSANVLVMGYDDEFTTGLKAKLESLQCSCICLSTDPSIDELQDIDTVLFLSRSKTNDDMIKKGEEQTHRLFNLTKLLANGSLPKLPSLWVVTNGAKQIEPKDPVHLGQSLLSGFINTAALEIPELQFYQLDLDPSVSPEMQVQQLINELVSTDSEDLIAYRENIRYVARLERMSPKTELVQLDTKSKGPLHNLYLKPLEWPVPLGPEEIAIEVNAAGLNFRDVLNAMGLYPGDPGPMGSECSGIITAVGKQVSHFNVGDEVLGIGSNFFANYTIGHENLFVLKPADLRFIDAAAIPIVFATAYYALHHLCHLQQGERVLIHAGAGGVGLAAIQIAQMLGAEIYATAGSEEKQEYLRQIGVKHVYHSRNLDYADQILVDTQSQGVDVVLNSLSGEGYIEHTLKACHPNARFVEIGKRNIWSEEEVAKAKPDLSYYILALDEMIKHVPEEVRNLLEEVIDLFTQKKLKPLPCITFNLEDAEAAFQYLRKAKQIGKVILLPRQPVRMNREGSYLITGGLGGLGLKVAEWLSTQGATHLVLTGRRQPSSEVSEVEKIRQAGTQVEIVSCDVSKEKEIEKLIQRFNGEWPQLKGIIHAAGVLNDGLIISQEWPAFENVYAPKVWGSWYLHKATKDLSLDFFILFSSAASVLGSPGQSNYASANAFLDALAAYRQNIGLPALSISWGSWSEVGMAANLVAYHSEHGMNAISPKKGVEALKIAINQPLPHLMIASIDWKKITTNEKSAFFAKLKQRKQKQAKTEILDVLRQSTNENRITTLKGYLKKVVQDVLGITQEFSDDLPITELGMDSLMAIEIRNKLQNDLGGKFPTSFALTYPTIQQLSNQVLIHLKIETGKEVKLEKKVTILEPREETGKPWQPLTRWTNFPERQMTLWALLPFANTPYITTGCYLNNLNLDMLKEAYSHILLQYPILSIEVSWWRPKYRVPKINAPTIIVIDLSDLSPEEQSKQILEKIREYLHVKDIWKNITFALIFKLSESNFSLRFFLTHLFDGHSLLIIFNKLLATYDALCSGKTPKIIQEEGYFSLPASLRKINEGVEKKIEHLEAFWKHRTGFYFLSDQLVDLEQEHCFSEQATLDAHITKLLYTTCAKQKINVISLISLFANFALNLLSNQTETAYQIISSLRTSSDKELGFLPGSTYYSIKQNDQMLFKDFVNSIKDPANCLDLAEYPFIFAYPITKKATFWTKYKIYSYLKLLLPVSPWKNYSVKYMSQYGGGTDYLVKTRGNRFPLTLTTNPYIYDIENDDLKNPVDQLIMTNYYFARTIQEKIYANFLLILKKEASLILHYESVLKPEVQKIILSIIEDLITTFVTSDADASNITLGEIKAKWMHEISALFTFTGKNSI